jgi:hypothetical protein
VKRGATACLLALAALAGCSLGGDDEPPRVTGAARQVSSVVERLEKAIVKGDWRSVCDDLLTADARRRAGGSDCPRLLRSDAADVRGARIDVLSIVLKKGAASARVRSRARGQPPLTDTIELRREGDGYRIESLRG